MLYNKSRLGHPTMAIIMILLLFCACQVYGQIQLIDIKTSKCLEEQGMGFKPLYKQTWLNDSILQIETTASANCAGVYQPRIAAFGPILLLKFDEHRPDGLVADCNCVFKNTWKIKGIAKKDKYILLLNGQLSSDYNPGLLNELLRSYSVDDNTHYFYLRNAVDKKGCKQGYQEFKTVDRTFITVYKNGEEQSPF